MKSSLRSVRTLTALSLVIAACSSAAGEDAASSDSEIASCAASVTTNKYDGPNYWGTLTFKNGPTAITGITVAFDVPSGAQCTSDAVPSGATLATTSNHCIFTFHSATLAANASKTFNYSTDTSQSFAASNVHVTFASCSPAPDAGTAHDSSAAPDSAPAPDSSTTNGCDTPGLVWHSANKTNFTSYPDPGSEECIKYNGCAYEGQFAACSKTESKSWVSSHNIVSVFPNLTRSSNGIGALALHDLCLKAGTKTIVVTVLDECADSDCSGCCTQNKGSAEELIDIESFTDARWGVPDGRIEWADLGPTRTSGCN
jgi:hypothetical protein